MLSYIRRFYRRNRRRVLVASGALALLYFGVGYVHSKFVAYQQRLALERVQREQIRRRFEQTQEDATLTVHALTQRVNAAVFEALNVEELTSALQQRRLEKRELTGSASVSSTMSDTTDETTITSDENRRSKNELWQELKVVSLTRLVTLVYVDALVVLLTRLQLNVLARREYLEDALEVASKRHGFNKIEMVDHSNSNSNGSDSHANEEAYLSFSWWVLNRGWIVVKQHVRASVEEVFEEITPRYELDVDELGVLLQRTQLLVEQRLSLDEALLPPQALETFVIQQTLDPDTLAALTSDAGAGAGASTTATALRVLVDETREYVRSSSAQIVLNSLANCSFGLFLREIDSLKKQPNGKLKLAVVLATTSKLAHVFKRPETCDFVAAMDRVVELDELSASVYSNFG